MRCAGCPLFTSWNNENDRGEACGLFGDGWDSPFQYEDKDGSIVGCYIDRHYIEKIDGTPYKGSKINSQHDSGFWYAVGEIVSVEDFDEDRRNECAPGIHFFITRQEAADW